MFRASAFLFLAVFVIRAILAIWGNTLGYDLPFHLANGREILTTGSIPHDDQFLAPIAGMPPHHFPNYEWLFGVISWQLFQAGGFTAIEGLRLGLIAAIFLVVGMLAWKATARSSASPAHRLMIVTVVLILGFTAAGRRFEPRPHLVSGLGLAFLALVLDGRRIAWSRVALFLGFGLVWANCHIEVLLGLGFCLLEALFTGMGTALVSDHPPSPPSFRSLFAPRAVLALGLLAAVLASPASWRMFTQAAEYYSRLSVVMEKYKFVNIEITPIEAGWLFQPFGLLLVLSFLGLFLGDGSPEDRRASLHRAAAVPFWLLPFLSNRHLLPAAVFLMPACGAALENLLSRIPTRARAPVLLLLLPLTMAWCFPTYGNPSAPHPEIGIRRDHTLEWHPGRTLPEGALRFLGLHGFGGRIFCPDRWGNFLLLSSRLSSGTFTPPLQPFIHNMIQAYPMQRLEEYLRILARPDEALGCLDRHGIDFVLLGLPDSPRDEEFFLSRRLRQSPDWRLVFWDDLAVLYARLTRLVPRPEVLPFLTVDPPLLKLDEMAMSRLASGPGVMREELSRARIASSGVEAVNTILWLAVRLEQEGDLDGAISMLRDLLSRHPRTWAILSKLGILLSRNGQRAAAISSLEQARSIHPRHAPTLFNLAVAYFSAGQMDLGLQRLDAARLADPGFLPALELEKKITTAPPLNRGDVRGNLKEPFSKGQMQ